VIRQGFVYLTALPFGPLTLRGSLSVSPREVDSIYPIRDRVYKGVGFTSSRGLEYYFLTRHVASVVSALKIAGFEVEMEERIPRKIWTQSR
jgi:hypothetical protein